MKISVIMFVWNMEEHLRKSIDSIIDNIGIEDYECILVDGNSDDKSQEICLEYQKNNKKITYIKLNEYDENKIWNLGLKYSTGEYVYFIKGCTFLNENFINEAVQYLDDNPDTSTYIRNYKMLTEDGNIMDYRHFFEAVGVGPRLSMCVFKKSCIKEYFINQTCSEPIFTGKIIYTNKYYYDRENLNSFIDTRSYIAKPFLYQLTAAEHIDWIKYTVEKIKEYKEKIS